MSTVAILGGTFDPVHAGHLRIATLLHRSLPRTPVLLMPAAMPGHRAEPAADAHHRHAMVRIAIEALPWARADDRELRLLARHPGRPTYARYALDSLLEEFGSAARIVWALGWDSFVSLPRWFDWETVATRLVWFVVPRPAGTANRAAVAPDDAVPAPLRARLRRLDSAAALPAAPTGSYYLHPTPVGTVSATSVRSALRELMLARSETGLRNLDGLLPAGVAAYILRHGLYRALADEVSNVPDARSEPSTSPPTPVEKHDA